MLNNPMMRSPNSDFSPVESTGDYDDGYLRIEYDNFYIACGGERIKLPRAEFLILARLSKTPNRIVSYEELWSCVWGKSKPLGTESLKVHIYNLRRLLKPFGIEFETMVNVGYRFVPHSPER